MIAILRQRLADWQRERRIRKWRGIASLPGPVGARAYRDMVDEVMARSPQQIARMERQLGLS